MPEVVASCVNDNNINRCWQVLDDLITSLKADFATAANGLPLGPEANPKKQKMLLLDTGIFQRLLGLNISGILLEDNFDVINSRTAAEALAYHPAKEVSVFCGFIRCFQKLE
jgi:hypothetical protein